jgi:malate dehydrogenase (oxaloacetate-decarboxylating)
VINGAGAAGIAIARLLRCVDNNNDACISVKHIIICDSKGAIHGGRTDLNDAKKEILKYSNPNNITGSIQEVMKGADVFIGVSVGNLISSEDVRNMANDSIIFALANPTPEIMPLEAKKGGAAIVGTGRSDLPNQVNNVLGFPGIFRGALDARAKRITPAMKLAAAFAIADSIDKPDFDHIIPSSLDKKVALKVAEAVKEVALKEKI